MNCWHTFQTNPIRLKLGQKQIVWSKTDPTFDLVLSKKRFEWFERIQCFQWFDVTSGPTSLVLTEATNSLRKLSNSRPSMKPFPVNKRSYINGNKKFDKLILIFIDFSDFALIASLTASLPVPIHWGMCTLCTPEHCCAQQWSDF